MTQFIKKANKQKLPRTKHTDNGNHTVKKPEDHLQELDLLVGSYRPVWVIWIFTSWLTLSSLSSDHLMLHKISYSSPARTTEYRH